MEQKAALYTYILPANETIYKGMNNDAFDQSYEKPIWFSQQEETAKHYGSFIHKVLTKRPLKLINITSPYFHSTFMDFLNDYCRNESDATEFKMHLLAPIGLPNEAAQETYLRQMNHLPPTLTQEHKEYIASNIPFFYNHHRFSRDDMDAHLVDFLQKIHGQYAFDGYIAPCIWPSKFHKKFSDEVCIFRIKSEMVEYAGCIKLLLGGGKGGYPISKPPAKYVERTAWKWLEILRNAGWEGPYEFNEYGTLKYPSLWEIGEFVKKKVADKKRQEYEAFMKSTTSKKTGQKQKSSNYNQI